MEMQLVGVGFRAAVQREELVMKIGFCHDVIFPIPDGMKVECPSPTLISVSGTHKQQVTSVAAKLRKLRPPDPYKGKGIRYLDEKVRLREVKKK